MLEDELFKEPVFYSTRGEKRGIVFQIENQRKKYNRTGLLC